LSSALLIRSLLKQFPLSKVKLGIWLKRLADKRTPMVIRTLLLSKEQYEQHLKSEKDFEGQAFTADEVAKLIEHLPKYFWLCEISLPDLYTANKSKVIDFVYVCDRPADVTEKEISDRWIQIRLPGACYFNRGSTPAIPLSIKSHYPLYRHEKEVRVSEW